MKALNLFTTILFFLSLTRVEANTFKSIEKAEDASDFFPVYDNLLYIQNFQTSSEDIEKYATSKDKKILKLPSNLLFYGFEKGNVIKVADFKTFKTTEYKIKEHVFVYISDFNNRAPNSSLVLSDDPKIHEKLISDKFKREEVTGIAYRGNDRKTIDVAVEWIPVLKVPQKTDQKKGKLFQYEIMISPVETDHGIKNLSSFYLKDKKGQQYSGMGNSFLLDDKGEKMKVINWLSGTKIIPVFNFDEGDIDSAVILCSADKLEYVFLGGNADTYHAILDD